MYQWTQWVDESDEYEGIFTETDLGGGMIRHDPVIGQVYVQGTPQDAAHWNNMEAGISDAHIAQQLMINALRQGVWRIEDMEQDTAQETGTVTLTNTQQFPFNNSIVTVPLTVTRENLNYVVEVIKVEPSGGPAGEIDVSERQVNGFKMAFTGSASSVKVIYAVIGGFN